MEVVVENGSMGKRRVPYSICASIPWYMQCSSHTGNVITEVSDAAALALLTRVCGQTLNSLGVSVEHVFSWGGKAIVSFLHPGPVALETRLLRPPQNVEEVLQVLESGGLVRQSYRKLSFIWHPDKWRHFGPFYQSIANGAFQAISAAIEKSKRSKATSEQTPP